MSTSGAELIVTAELCEGWSSDCGGGDVAVALQERVGCSRTAHTRTALWQPQMKCCPVLTCVAPSHIDIQGFYPSPC